MEPDGQRQVRVREFLTVALAGLDEAVPLLVKFAFQPLGNGVCGPQRQRLAEESGWSVEQVIEVVFDQALADSICGWDP
jgi:hypothetical protein